MGKGAPIRWVENQFLRRHLRGRGVEIGALWRRAPVATGARVWYVDRLAAQDVAQHYAEIGRPVPVNLVADAAALPFRESSLDFIIASHVLEHLPFPLSALRHWYQLLTMGGHLLLRIPDKRHTFDRRRERTRLEHLQAEEAQPEKFDRRAHFEEWLEKVEGQAKGTAEFTRNLEALMARNYSIHYHAWITEDICQLLRFTREQWGVRWQRVIFLPARFYRKEIVVLLRKAPEVISPQRHRGTEKNES